MGGASWIYFLFSPMLNYFNFGRIWLTGGAVGSTKNTKILVMDRTLFSPNRAWLIIFFYQTFGLVWFLLHVFGVQSIPIKYLVTWLVVYVPAFGESTMVNKYDVVTFI